MCLAVSWMLIVISAEQGPRTSGGWWAPGWTRKTERLEKAHWWFWRIHQQGPAVCQLPLFRGGSWCQRKIQQSSPTKSAQLVHRHNEIKEHSVLHRCISLLIFQATFGQIMSPSLPRTCWSFELFYSAAPATSIWPAATALTTVNSIFRYHFLTRSAW